MAAQQLALYSLLLFAAAAFGGLIPTLRPELTKRSRAFILSLASGILLGTAFLHMLPEAVEIVGAPVVVAVLVGFVSLLLLEKFVMVHPCEEMDCHFHHLGMSAFLGISLHSFMDGVALGASMTDPRLSFLVFLAIVVHEIPCGFSLGSLLLLGQHPRGRVIALILLYAIMTPLGAILTWLMALNLPATTVGWALGFSAGNFLFVATADLLPQLHLHEKKNRMQILWLLAGLGISWLGLMIEG
ncbi:MAG: ZIP family metal transporter [Candidatus Eisenbacteria bacterium]|nr:ZIP family metal transporter [Candidatus Eisenbacteria bacterium]